MREFVVYILASKSRRLYVGVTNDIVRRVSQHRAGDVAFTARYRITRLVHCERTRDVRSAIEREKEIKSWVRSKKLDLIQSSNPTWDDFAADWTGAG
jgi:putative endonuclease